MKKSALTFLAIAAAIIGGLVVNSAPTQADSKDGKVLRHVVLFKFKEDLGEAKVDDVSDSADIDQHTKTNALKIHHAQVDADTKNFSKPDEILGMEDEPDHQELCDREQAYFLKAIREDVDLTESMDAAVNSLRIVLAAEESIEKQQAVFLD